MFILSPLDQFEIQTLVSTDSTLINLNPLNLTNFAIYSLLIFSFIFLFTFFILSSIKISGSKSFLTLEILFDSVKNIMLSQLPNPSAGLYFPLIFTFFIIILFANLFSMVPYSFALTAQFIWVIALSFSIWLGVTILGFFKHGSHFFSLLIPSGTPLLLTPLLTFIELLSYLARAISLGLRLAANILAGHLLLIILSALLLLFMSISLLNALFALIPFLALIAIFVLEFAVCFIQSYVWATLLASYLKDSLFLH